MVETRRPGFSATDSAQRPRRAPRLPGRGDRYARALPFPWRSPGVALSWVDGAVRPEILLQPSPEQLALIAARRADPAGSLRVLAFAGAGKTTALRLLAEADPSPALYLAYNKAAQLQARARFPAHVACRTVHSLAFRATRMFEQKHRLERRLAAREVAETLAIPALDGLRPSFWAYCAIATVRAFTRGAAREIDAGHLPPLPRGADRAEAVLGWARRLWADMRDPKSAVPLEHDAYLKLWHLDGARLPAGAEVLYLDEAQDANPVTLAVLEAQRRPTVWVGDSWQSVYRFRGSVNAMRVIAAPQRHLSRSWRFGEELAGVARAILAHSSQPPAVPLRGDPGIVTTLGPVRPPCAVLCRTNAGLFEAAVRGRDPGSTSWAAWSRWSGWCWAAGTSTSASPRRRCRPWPGSGAGTSCWRRRGRAATRSCASWCAWSRSTAGRCRGWWRSCGGGRCRTPTRRTGCWRRRTRPRGWSGRRCAWPPTSRASTSWTRQTRTGCPGSPGRSGTRSCTCCTWRRPGPGAGLSRTRRSRAASPRRRVRPWRTGDGPPERGGSPRRRPTCPRAPPGGRRRVRPKGRLPRGRAGTCGRSPRRRGARRAARPRTGGGSPRSGATASAGRAPAPARRRARAPRRASAAAATGRRRTGRAVPRAGRAGGAGGRPAGRPGCAAGPPPSVARRGPPPPPPPRCRGARSPRSDGGWRGRAGAPACGPRSRGRGSRPGSGRAGRAAPPAPT